MTRALRKYSGFYYLLMLTALLLVIPRSIRADSVEDSAQEIYYETLSPFCPGRALADCPTEQAHSLREKIKSELSTGKSKEEVYEWVLKEYGEHLRAIPNMTGLNAVAWILPGVIVVVGLLVVVRKIRSKDEKEPEDLD